MEQCLWNIFESTGNIEVYLTYTSFRKSNDRIRHHMENGEQLSIVHKKAK